MNQFLAASPDFKCVDINGLGYYVCYSTNTGAVCSDYTLLPTFKYQFDSSTYTLPPAAYTFDVSNTCFIAVYPSLSTDTYIFGEAFGIQYPIRYNYNHNTVGFAINTNAVAGVEITH